eukprot:s12538_g1.t1
MHLGSRYTFSLPAPELNDDLVYNVIRSIKECGLTGKAVTFRLDNEASLASLVDRVGRSSSCPASAVITDVVAGYRPQSKGSIEKQVGDVGEVFPDEGVDGDGDEEMIEDELADYSPSHAGDEDGPVIEGDGDGDMEVDWLVNHLLEPDLLYQSMKLELEELEAFGVGDVISESEARRSARESGRRVLTTRWVNSVKRPGLYRSRLVVRDYASMGGTTLAEGIYSPTTSLEGLKLLLALLCKRGSVLSCDV